MSIWTVLWQTKATVSFPLEDKHVVNERHVARKSHNATQKKCLHVMHFNVPHDWFETNLWHQKRYSEGGKNIRGCCGLLGRVISDLINYFLIFAKWHVWMSREHSLSPGIAAFKEVFNMKCKTKCKGNFRPGGNYLLIVNKKFQNTTRSILKLHCKKKTLKSLSTTASKMDFDANLNGLFQHQQHQ